MTTGICYSPIEAALVINATLDQNRALMPDRDAVPSALWLDGLYPSALDIRFTVHCPLWLDKPPKN